MATYNGANYIRDQIDSILNQDLSAYPDAKMEIIVSDDMSSDETVSILESYNDTRIKIVPHRQRQRHIYNKAAWACSENFAHALSYATGDYIFLSDQDDIWYPWKMERALSTLIHNSGGIVGAAFDIGHKKGLINGTIKYKKEPRFQFIRKHIFYGFTIAFDRSEFKYIHPIPHVPYHDNFITYVGGFRKKLHIIDEPCAFHLYTGEHNVSSKKNDMPFLIRNYFRIKLVLIALYRSLIW